MTSRPRIASSAPTGQARLAPVGARPALISAFFPSAACLLLRQRAVVLLDEVLIAGRDLVGAGEIERVVRGVHALAEIELELRQLVERRRGELFERARIG